MGEFEEVQLRVTMGGLSAEELTDASTVEEWTATLTRIAYHADDSTTELGQVAQLRFARAHDLMFEDRLLNRLDTHSAELLYAGEQLVGPTGEIDMDLIELRTSLIIITHLDTAATDQGWFRMLTHGIARIFNDSIIGIIPEDHATTPLGVGTDEIRLRTLTRNCAAAGFTPHRGGLLLLPHPERLTAT